MDIGTIRQKLNLLKDQIAEIEQVLNDEEALAMPIERVQGPLLWNRPRERRASHTKGQVVPKELHQSTLRKAAQAGCSASNYRKNMFVCASKKCSTRVHNPR